MNEEYRWFDDFRAAYSRLDEIDNLTKFLEVEISMHGPSCTLEETQKRLVEECVKTKQNMLGYFKGKEERI